MNKEWDYLESFKDRHDRIRKSNGEPQTEANSSTRYFNSQEPKTRQIANSGDINNTSPSHLDQN